MADEAHGSIVLTDLNKNCTLQLDESAISVSFTYSLLSDDIPSVLISYKSLAPANSAGRYRDIDVF